MAAGKKRARMKTPRRGPEVAEVISIEASITPDRWATIKATPIMTRPQIPPKGHKTTLLRLPTNYVFMWSHEVVLPIILHLEELDTRTLVMTPMTLNSSSTIMCCRAGG